LFLEILAIVILVLFALFAAVLLIPFDLTVEASMAQTSMRSSVIVRWLGIRLLRRDIPGKEKKRAKQVKQGQEAGSSRLDLLARVPRLLSLLVDAAPSLVGILKGFGRAVRFRRLSIDVSFGVGDPADTAVLAGYLWSFAWALDFLPRTSLSLRPDMERARLDGYVSAELGIRLLPIVVAFLIAYTKKPFRRLVKEARQGW
jgi:Protein of unknown function (DUF2953)